MRSLVFSIDIILPAALWALGSTQPPTEMSTRNLPGDKGRPTREADNLATIRKWIVYKMWEPRRLTILWVSTACFRDIFTYLYKDTFTYALSSLTMSMAAVMYRKICSLSCVLRKHGGNMSDLHERALHFCVLTAVTWSPKVGSEGHEKSWDTHIGPYVCSLVLEFTEHSSNDTCVDGKLVRRNDKGFATTTMEEVNLFHLPKEAQEELIRMWSHDIEPTLQDMTSCNHRRFRGHFCFHLQGWRISQIGNLQEGRSKQGLLFDDEGGRSLRNVSGLLPDHTALHPTR
jgi:hypothetical protein